MANIRIVRNHALGLPRARQIASTWAAMAEKDLSMTCTTTAGTAQDHVNFSRSGVTGSLTVTHDKFELDAKLGFLLGAFKDRIESEIVKNLDKLLAVVPDDKSAAKPAANAAMKVPKVSKTKKAT